MLLAIMKRMIFLMTSLMLISDVDVDVDFADENVFDVDGVVDVDDFDVLNVAVPFVDAANDLLFAVSDVATFKR